MTTYPPSYENIDTHRFQTNVAIERFITTIAIVFSIIACIFNLVLFSYSCYIFSDNEMYYSMYVSVSAFLLIVSFPFSMHVLISRDRLKTLIANNRELYIWTTITNIATFAFGIYYIVVSKNGEYIYLNSLTTTIFLIIISEIVFIFLLSFRMYKILTFCF